MDAATHCLIEALHGVPWKCALAVTGGGTQAAALLLNVPGGSRTVLEVVVPYHENALAEYLGRRPEQYCSADTSRDLAERALERARRLAPGEPVVGVGCTASLATDRPKRGDHRVYLTVQSATQVLTWSLTLSKGVRDRPGEEWVVDALLLNLLAETFGVPHRLVLPLLPEEKVEVESSPAPGMLAAFLRGEVATVCQEFDGRFRADAPRPAGLLPGSFNPLHEGHRRLALVAAALIGGPVELELSIANVDKPALGAEEVHRRLRQLGLWFPVWLTRAPTFVQKAKLFPNTVFVVGADTAVRILALDYYSNDERRRDEALEQIRSQGCRFLVAGRVNQDGSFLGMAQIEVPDRFRDLFEGIAETAFRYDISSTVLRAGDECGKG